MDSSPNTMDNLLGAPRRQTIGDLIESNNNLGYANSADGGAAAGAGAQSSAHNRSAAGDSAAALGAARSISELDAAVASRTVITKRIVDACKALQVPVSRRGEAEYIERQFDEQMARLITYETDSESGVESRQGSNLDGDDVPQRITTNNTSSTNRRASSGLGDGAERGDSYVAQQDGEGGGRRFFSFGSGAGSRAKSRGSTLSPKEKAERDRQAKRQMLLAARNLLISESGSSAEKEIFGAVPRDWLTLARRGVQVVIFACMLCVLPCLALMMDCTKISCVVNNASINATPAPGASHNGSVPRPTYLHSTVIGDCPFDSWPQALFGIWFIVGAAGIFGGIIAIWSVADKCFHPFSTYWRDSMKPIINTLATVPFSTRLFVVVPPLLGLGATGSMIYARLMAKAERVTWSWGFIVAPAVVGIGVMLCFKLFVQYKFLAAGAAGSGADVDSALPVAWARRLLAFDALCLVVAATVTPSVLAKMADCNGFTYWRLAFIPMLVFLGESFLSELIEILYRVANAGDSESQELSFAPDAELPIWQEALKLVFREGSMMATATMLWLKLDLRWADEYRFIEWKWALLPVMIYSAIGFLTSIVEYKIARQFAREQYCVLDEVDSKEGAERSMISLGNRNENRYGAVL